MKIIGKIIGINTSDNLFNLTVVDELENIYNLKTSVNNYNVGNVYCFNVEEIKGERVSYKIINYSTIEELNFKEADQIFRNFMPSAPLPLEKAMTIIDSYINHIDSNIIKEITSNLLSEYTPKYFTYPAASRLHHAYVGGLAYHCVGMLRMADAFIENYSYLNKDYLYAGIILHDLGKIQELTGIQNTEYSLDGQLLGHLVIGALEISKMATKLGYDETEEVKILKHLLISHHGQPQFGAAKRPMTPEAIALWYIDTIDSKFRVLGEELVKTESGKFTESIGVLDKIKVYKSK